ncbi:SlyX family protein [Faucicola atlantae]|uniref:SlyX family protein n=1 Tax=Faucicola atlantae TaxID=34059 RepID=UPI003EBED523
MKPNTADTNADRAMPTDLLADMQQAIIDLQSQIAFLEDTVEALNLRVAEQSRELADQHRQLQLLYQKIDSQTTTNTIAPFDLLADKPPHY